MKLLLDTHVFIWADAEPEKLSPNVAGLIKDTDNQLFLSVVSVWEMQIKVQLGKLTLRTDLDTLIGEQEANNGLELLPVVLPHVLALGKLPALHKDPFDRLLVAQTLQEGFALLSHDKLVQQYPIPVVWN